MLYCDVSHVENRPTQGLDFNKRLVKSHLVVWRSAFPREKKHFLWRKDKEVLDWLLGLPHSARLTSKISQLKNYRNFRLGELDTAVGLDLTRRCRCQASSLGVVAYRRAGVIRNDPTGNLRNAIAGRPRVSSRPWARLGVIGATPPSSTGLDGGNSKIIRGRCAERQFSLIPTTLMPLPMMRL
jgi:hypothetical protein